MILDEIVSTKRKEVEELKKKLRLPLERKSLPKTRDFAKAIKKSGISLIAEAKAASPSSGIIMKDYDPVSIAKVYEKSGAAAVSILTDEKHFSGNIGHLTDVKEAVKIPVLRKDFIIDEAQIYESRLAGADAVLLIVRLLMMDELKRFIKISSDLGMTALVEAHSIREAQQALDAKAEVIGINNRDLNTLKVDLATTVNMINALPRLKKKVLVSESGINERSEVDLMRELGVNAVLVGEAILKSPDMGAKIRELIG